MRSIRTAVFVPTILVFVLTGFLVGCDESLPTESLKEEPAASPGAATQAATTAQTQSNFGEVIPGEYIVVFKDNVNPENIPGLAEGLAQQAGGAVFSVWTKALRGFALKGISEAAAEALKQNPNVKYVEPNGYFLRGGVRQTVGFDPGDRWGLDRVDQRSGFDNLYTAGATGSGVTVYVIDSGIRISHNEFVGRASHGYDFVDNDAVAEDCTGHGTGVASIIGGATFGVAQNVDLVSVRVLGCDNFGQPADIVDGIEWVMTNGTLPLVINMSIDSFRPFFSVNDAVQNAIDAGLPVVTIAGNFNQDASTSSPGSVVDAITVGSTDVNDTREAGTNFGDVIDLFAPGKEVKMADFGSDSDTQVNSGTSFAAPHVAGTAALRLEFHPQETPQQVRDAIVQYATQNVVADAQSANDHLLYSLLNHPKAPTNLTASCVPDDTPRLDWYASPSSDVDYYVVERSTNSSQGYSSIGTSQTTDYNDTSLWCADGSNADDAYYYRVHAVDTENLPSGESNWDGVLTTNDPPYLNPYSTPQADSLQTVR